MRPTDTRYSVGRIASILRPNADFAPRVLVRRVRTNAAVHLLDGQKWRHLHYAV